MCCYCWFIGPLQSDPPNLSDPISHCSLLHSVHIASRLFLEHAKHSGFLAFALATYSLWLHHLPLKIPMKCSSLPSGPCSNASLSERISLTCYEIAPNPLSLPPTVTISLKPSVIFFSFLYLY